MANSHEIDPGGIDLYRFSAASETEQNMALQSCRQKEAQAIDRYEKWPDPTPEQTEKLQQEMAKARADTVRLVNYKRQIMDARSRDDPDKPPALLGHPAPTLDHNCKDKHHLRSHQVVLQQPSLACTNLSDKAEDAARIEMAQYNTQVCDLADPKSLQLRVPPNMYLPRAHQRGVATTPYRRVQETHENRLYLPVDNTYRAAQYEKRHSNKTRTVTVLGPQSRLIMPGHTSATLNTYWQERMYPPQDKIIHPPVSANQYSVTNVKHTCEVRAIPSSQPPVVLTPVTELLKPDAPDEVKQSVNVLTLDTVCQPSRYLQPSPDVSMPTGQPYCLSSKYTEAEVAAGVIPRPSGDDTQAHLSYSQFYPSFNSAHATKTGINNMITEHCNQHQIPLPSDSKRNFVIQMMEGDAANQMKPWDLAVHDLEQATLNVLGQAGAVRLIIDPEDAKTTMAYLLKDHINQPVYSLTVYKVRINLNTTTRVTEHRMKGLRTLGAVFNHIRMTAAEKDRAAFRLTALREVATALLTYTPHQLRFDDYIVKDNWEGADYVSCLALGTVKGEVLVFAPDSIIEGHTVEQQLTDDAKNLFSAGPPTGEEPITSIIVYNKEAFEEVFIRSLGCWTGYNWLDIKPYLYFAMDNPEPRAELRQTMLFPLTRSETHYGYMKSLNSLIGDETFIDNQLKNLSATAKGTGETLVQTAKPHPFLLTSKRPDHNDAYSIYNMIDGCNTEARLTLNRVANNTALTLHCFMIIAQTYPIAVNAESTPWNATIERMNRRIDMGLKADIDNNENGTLINQDTLRFYDEKQLAVNASQPRLEGQLVRIDNAPVPMTIMQLRRLMMDLAVKRASNAITDSITTNLDLTQNDVQSVAQQCGYLVTKNILAEASTQLKRLRKANVNPALLKLDSTDHRFYDFAHDSGRAVTLMIMIRHGSVETPMPISDKYLDSRLYESHNRVRELNAHRLMTHVLTCDEMQLPQSRWWVGAATMGLPALSPFSYTLLMPDHKLMIAVVGKYTDAYTHHMAQMRARVTSAPVEEMTRHEIDGLMWGQPLSMAQDLVQHTDTDPVPPRLAGARRYRRGLPKLHNTIPDATNPDSQQAAHNAQTQLAALKDTVEEDDAVQPTEEQARQERTRLNKWENHLFRVMKAAKLIEVGRNEYRHLMLHTRMPNDRLNYDGNIPFGMNRPGTLKDKPEVLRQDLTATEIADIQQARLLAIQVSHDSARLAVLRSELRAQLIQQQHNTDDTILNSERDAIWQRKLTAVRSVFDRLRNKNYVTSNITINMNTYDLMRSGLPQPIPQAVQVQAQAVLDIPIPVTGTSRTLPADEAQPDAVTAPTPAQPVKQQEQVQAQAVSNIPTPVAGTSRTLPVGETQSDATTAPSTAKSTEQQEHVQAQAAPSIPTSVAGTSRTLPVDKAQPDAVAAPKAAKLTEQRRQVQPQAAPNIPTSVAGTSRTLPVDKAQPDAVAAPKADKSTEQQKQAQRQTVSDTLTSVAGTSRTLPVDKAQSNAPSATVPAKSAEQQEQGQTEAAVDTVIPASGTSRTLPVGKEQPGTTPAATTAQTTDRQKQVTIPGSKNAGNTDQAPVPSNPSTMGSTKQASNKPKGTEQPSNKPDNTGTKKPKGKPPAGPSRQEPGQTKSQLVFMTHNETRQAVMRSNDYFVYQRQDHAATIRTATQTLTETTGCKSLLARQVLGAQLLTNPEEAISDPTTLMQLLLVTMAGLSKQGLPVPQMWLNTLLKPTATGQEQPTSAQLEEAQEDLDVMMADLRRAPIPEAAKVSRKQALLSNKRTPFTQPTSTGVQNQVWKGTCPAEYLADDRGCCGHRPGEPATHRGSGYKYQVSTDSRIETTVPNTAALTPGRSQRDDIEMDMEMCGHFKPQGSTLSVVGGYEELEVARWSPALPKQRDGMLPPYDDEHPCRTAYAKAMMLCRCCYSPNHTDSQCSTVYYTRLRWEGVNSRNLPQRDLLRTALKSGVKWQFRNFPSLMYMNKDLTSYSVPTDVLTNACDLLLLTTPQIIAHTLADNDNRLNAWLCHYACTGLDIQPQHLHEQTIARLYRTLRLLREDLSKASSNTQTMWARTWLVPARAYILEGDDEWQPEKEADAGQPESDDDETQTGSGDETP